jgi:beta-lactamase regulating signal transducer with metallopeptidase domain
MTALLLRIGLSNALFALAIALLATAVGTVFKRPQLTHLLWLLVFVKLVTPPLVTIPITALPEAPRTAAAEDAYARLGLPFAARHALGLTPTGPTAAGGSSALRQAPRGPYRLLESLPLIWLAGCGLVLAVSLVRAIRFNRLLTRECRPASPELRAAAAGIANRLGLRTLPTILTTSANLSPLVWWMGGKVRLVLPESVLAGLDAGQRQWVLAHELAHVRRRDYLVRWLEWLACVAFWWNPVVWWAQRNLRAMEELCCDAFVVASLRPQPHAYANAILTAVEALIQPVLRPPAMASEVNSGGVLERRFRMLLSNNTTPFISRWIYAAVLLCAIVVLPLGVARAQDYHAIGARLKEAVAKGEITQKQALTMMAALKKSTTGGGKDTDVDREALATRLKAAVVAGEMTEEAAWAKWEELTGEERDIGSWLESIGKRLRAAVAAGEITEKEAWADWEYIKKHEVTPKLEAAVKEGRIGQEEFDEIWYEIKKSETGSRLKSAVEKGEITAEEARAKWHALYGDDEKEAEGAAAGIEQWFFGLGDQLKAAVDAGEISKEDAWAKWYRMKEEELGPKLKAALAEGAITEKEARAIWHHVDIAEAREKGDLTKEEADAQWDAVPEKKGE